MGAKVYEAIANVMKDMAHAGIQKDRRNDQQGYAFRGIDDVYNSLAPLLSRHGLCILPYILDRDVVERQTARGGTLFYVTVKARFDFVSAEDGSKHEVITYGEAMDSGDKATNKAMSAAYKYAAIQTFCIPTQGDNDADAQTHEVIPDSQENEEAAAVEYLLNEAADAASKGLENYKTFWTKLDGRSRHLIGEKRHADFKALAETATA